MVNWDDLIMDKFRQNVEDDSIFCDVGACDGIYTSFFKNMPGSMVYSFELNPTNFEKIKHLSSEKCVCENIAISDKSEVVNIYSDDIGSGNHISNIIGHDTSFRPMDTIGTIESTSLDEYFKDIKVDFMKIDVEGAELKVIKGGVKTISNCKFVIIECHYDEDWEEIYQILSENGLNFKNLVNDEKIFFGPTTKIQGRSDIGRPYQMYLKQ